MADYFCQFSCLLSVDSVDNAQRAIDIRGDLAAELHREEGGCPGFDLESSHEDGEGVLWIYSDEYGEPEHVVRFVQRCATAFDLTGPWGFTWSTSCSKPRIDAFGGGAHVLDLSTGATIADIDCSNFVHEHVMRGEEHAEVAPSHTSGGGNDP